MQNVEILSNGLSAVEKLYDQSMYGHVDLFRIKDLVHSLKPNHWIGKQWLVDELLKIYDGDGIIHCAGGWYGLIAYLIKQKFQNNTVISSDIDEYCSTLGKVLFKDKGINFYDMDMAIASIKGGDVFITTSGEHIDREDLVSIINMCSYKYIVIQSNDYFEVDSHVNCSENLEEFKNYLQPTLSKIHYFGELNLGKYNRFMIIGEK